MAYGLFDEEGLASYVGYELRPTFPGFPVYGTPLDVVVGHWTSTGHGIPLATLRSQHRELNLKCSFQGYAFRASLFIYLGDRFGAATMRDFVAHMGKDNAYEQTFGFSLEELETHWRSAILEQFEARVNRQVLVDSYLSQPAVANAYVCTAGVDF